VRPFLRGMHYPFLSVHGSAETAAGNIAGINGGQSVVTGQNASILDRTTATSRTSGVLMNPLVFGAYPSVLQKRHLELGKSSGARGQRFESSRAYQLEVPPQFPLNAGRPVYVRVVSCTYASRRGTCGISLCSTRVSAGGHAAILPAIRPCSGCRHSPLHGSGRTGSLAVRRGA
jgi:hypothetical protein